MEQEKIIILDRKEQKDIIEILQAYKDSLEKAYKQIKRQKPTQTFLLSKIVEECKRSGALIIKLKNK